jgi:beta-mannanase
LAKLEAAIPGGAAAAAAYAEKAEAIVSSPEFAAEHPAEAAAVSAAVVVVVSTPDVASAAPALAAQVAVQATYVANVPAVVNDPAASASISTVTTTVTSMVSNNEVTSTDVASAATIGSSGNQAILVTTTAQTINPTVVSESE